MSKELHEQIADLQSRFAFQEDSIHKLSDSLYKQQCRIDDLELQLQNLKNELEKAQEPSQNAASDVERPPHY